MSVSRVSMVSRVSRVKVKVSRVSNVSRVSVRARASANIHLENVIVIIKPVFFDAVGWAAGRHPTCKN